MKSGSYPDIAENGSKKVSKITYITLFEERSGAASTGE